MFLIGSPGREVSNLQQEAAEGLLSNLLQARTLPSQRQHTIQGLLWQCYSMLLMFSSDKVQYTSNLPMISMPCHCEER
jgi:hypothetical protein